MCFLRCLTPPETHTHTHAVIAEVNAEREEGKAELKREKVSQQRVKKMAIMQDGCLPS